MRAREILAALAALVVFLGGLFYAAADRAMTKWAIEPKQTPSDLHRMDSRFNIELAVTVAVALLILYLGFRKPRSDGNEPPNNAGS